MEDTLKLNEEIRCEYTIHVGEISHQCEVVAFEYSIIGKIAEVKMNLCAKHKEVLKKRYKII